MMTKQQQQQRRGPKLIGRAVLLLLTIAVALTFLTNEKQAIFVTYTNAPQTNTTAHVNREALVAAAAHSDEVTTHHIAQSSSPSGGLKLSTPAFVVGFPKSGTTSVYRFFNCSGVVTQHYCSGGERRDHPPCRYGKMSNCILQNMAKPNRTMLQGCGDYTVYAQIDGERDTGGIFLPQHFHLDRLHQEYPDATFILPLREPNEWARSVVNWFQLKGKFVKEYTIKSSNHTPPARGRAVQFLKSIYMEHTEFIQDFVRQHPSHTLVQFNISDANNAGNVLAQAFGLDTAQTCWGHYNLAREKTDSK